MNRVVVSFVTLCTLSAFLAVVWISAPANAQDRSEERIATLETQVSRLQDTADGHGRAIERLEDQVGELRAPENGARSSHARSDQPTPTLAARVDAPTPAAPGLASTRDNPVPLGQAAQVGDWTVTVLDTVPNGTDAVLTENDLNDPPREGRQFFLITLSATYKGTESATILGGLTFEAVGASSVSYTTYDPSCGVIPNDLATVNEIFPGGTLEGTVCFQVTAEDADSLVMYVEPSFSLEEQRVWFAVRPA